jgi:hypothetical protein
MSLTVLLSDFFFLVFFFANVSFFIEIEPFYIIKNICLKQKYVFENRLDDAGVVGHVGINQLFAAITNLGDTMNHPLTGLGALSTSVTNLSNTVTNLSNTVNHPQTGLVALSNTVTNLSNTINHPQTGLVALNTSVTNNRTRHCVLIFILYYYLLLFILYKNYSFIGFIFKSF